MKFYSKRLFISIIILGISFLPSKQTEAQSYPFKQKKSIYHKGWIDFNKNGKEDPYENPGLPTKKRIDDLLNQMTMKEKTAQLVTLYGYGAVLEDAQPKKYWKDTTWVDGIGNIDEQLNGRIRIHKSKLFWPPSRHAKALNNIQRFFIEQTRLGIPAEFTNEGLRGLSAFKATSFPAEIGQGSTWDVPLINKIGHVEGSEAQALGYDNVYAPEADPARDPRWGRVPSTYGEDPYLDSRLSVAMTKGLQDEGIVSTLKHFAVYSIPKGGRDGANRTDPHATPREVKTIFFPPFKACVEAGALGVMSSYNDYNGIPVTGSYHFLTQILHQKWGFKGYIVTDSGALRHIHSKHHVQSTYQGAIKQALEAGVNVRTTFRKPSQFLDPLRKAIKNGEIPMSIINQRVREVLYVKFWEGLFDHPYVDGAQSNDRVRTQDAQNLSLQAAEESLVLLKNNDHVLPLDKNKIQSILVAGPNADMTKSLVHGYGPFGMKVSSVLDGIKDVSSSGTNITYVKGVNVRDDEFPKSDIMDTPLSQDEKDGIQKAVQAAKHSDVAIVVVGENNKTVGESRSRVSLKLPGHQLALVKAVQKTGTPTVVILLNGQPLTINWIEAHVPGILEAWFPGAHTGEALANVLFGKYNPGGKLPITFPRTVGQIQLNFPYMPASQSYLRSDHQTNSDYFSTKTRVTGPLYAFGYGLSYTNFKYSDLKVTPSKQHSGGKIQVSVDVKNTGKRKGDEVVQLYLNEKVTPVITPVRRLRGFKRISLSPGQTKTVKFTLAPEDLQLLNKHGHWQVVPGRFEVMVGSSSVDIRQKGDFKIIAERNNNKTYNF
jgi:beta-glucosidase